MKTILSLAVWAALNLAAAAQAADDDGVALAIVFDTSGSMKESVRDHDGRSSPKYIIANRALVAVARQIEAFATNSPGGTPRKIQCGLFTFTGNSASEVVPFGPFDARALEKWASGFSSPAGGTPLGNALTVAHRTVLNSPLPRKHILVITDGNNTVGPDPAATLPGLMRRAQQNHATVSVHFVAFDVDAKVFDPIKRLGATVVSAANETQLNSQLNFILQKKILLEEEEPPKPK